MSFCHSARMCSESIRASPNLSECCSEQDLGGIWGFVLITEMQMLLSALGALQLRFHCTTLHSPVIGVYVVFYQLGHPVY